MVDDKESFNQETPIISVIEDVRAGVVDPRTLTKEVRLSCVEVFVGEGYSEVQVAQILKRSEKTIQRDVREIRERNSLTPGIEFAKQMSGDIFKKGLAHHDYLVRLSNGKNVSDANKIQARVSAWRVLVELIERLQSLGLMPLKPKELVGDIYHHYEGGDTKAYSQLRKDLQEIERVSKETGTLDEKTEENIKLLQQKIEKAEIVEEISELTKKKDELQNNKEVCDGQ
ncbi:MAG: hypothetical protein HQL24_04080 [Candidatus Omnitrophica bacterium]|nr:hypothetical protein [Candidatus Omnitrophota bacterium]